MLKSKRLDFIPTTINFSQMTTTSEEDELPVDFQPFFGVEVDYDSVLLEKTILEMISSLPKDRDRVVLLFQILRGNGFNFDHRSIASLLGVTLRRYFRIVAAMREKLAPFDRA